MKFIISFMKGGKMNELRVLQDMHPMVRYKAVLTDGEATVKLSYSHWPKLESAIEKAVEQFRMKLVNLYME